MATKNPAEIAAQLERLRQAYAADLDSKLDELEQQLKFSLAADAPGAISGRLDALRAQAHTLAGSAGTFGFVRLGELAKDMENAIVAAVGRGEGATERTGNALQTLLNAMRCEVSAGAAGAPSMLAPQPFIARFEPSGPRRVVVVEDDPAVADFIRLHLGSFGFEVKLFPSVAGLEAYLAQHPPAALIMDIVLGQRENSGLQAVADLRARDLLKCPVVFSTIRDDFDARLQAARIGCDAYLLKPVQPLDLLRVMQFIVPEELALPYQALVVDDDAELARAYAVLLEAQGVEARPLSDPTHLLTVLKERPFDVIILDVHMPVASGFELTEMIHQMPEWLGVPIVFLTADTTVSARIRALRAGGNAFLSKPASPELVVDTVLGMARRSRRLRWTRERLLEREQHFRTAIEMAAVPMFVADRAGRLLFVNTALGTLFDATPAQLFGRNLVDLVGGDSRDTLANVMASAVSNEASDIGLGRLAATRCNVRVRAESTLLSCSLSLTRCPDDGQGFFVGMLVLS
jgi:DNA-binding response OmpR family regulator/HPt (histidine-containing phosphotransfer) domain-containing protein